MATLYTRLAQVTDGFGLTQEQVARTTETTALALAASGASAAESAAVVRQFSQALGSGALRGDGFNSIMENGGRLAKALADGLGLPIGRLRALAERGLLTTDIMTRALESQREAIEREAAAMPLTIGRAMSQVADQFGASLRRLDEASGASAALSLAITALGRNLDTILGGVAAAAAFAAALARALQAVGAALLTKTAALRGTTAAQTALNATMAAGSGIARGLSVALVSDGSRADQG